MSRARHFGDVCATSSSFTLIWKRSVILTFSMWDHPLWSNWWKVQSWSGNLKMLHWMKVVLRSACMHKKKLFQLKDQSKLSNKPNILHGLPVSQHQYRIEPQARSVLLWSSWQLLCQDPSESVCIYPHTHCQVNLEMLLWVQMLALEELKLLNLLLEGTSSSCVTYLYGWSSGLILQRDAWGHNWIFMPKQLQKSDTVRKYSSLHFLFYHLLNSVSFSMGM